MLYSMVEQLTTARPANEDDRAAGSQSVASAGFADAFARSRKGDIAWERNKGDVSKLIKYWTRGAGAAKIGWGKPCDFCSCLGQLRKYVPPAQVKGFCARLHKRATGTWPGPRGQGKGCPC